MQSPNGKRRKSTLSGLSIIAMTNISSRTYYPRVLTIYVIKLVKAGNISVLMILSKLLE